MIINLDRDNLELSEDYGNENRSEEDAVMSGDAAGAAEAKRKEIYAYQAPWPIYGMNWSQKVGPIALPHPSGLCPFQGLNQPIDCPSLWSVGTRTGGGRG